MTNQAHDRVGDSEVPVPSFSAIHVDELRRSWERVVPMADEAAQLFYARLFELNPSLRLLFHTDPAIQRQKLMDALALVVTCADRPNELLPMLSALGERHAGYGVHVEHYAIAREALLWTLDQGLGLLPTREAREAWVSTYTFVATAMCGGTGRHESDGTLAFPGPG
jgi:hemoglobin-like flavoprotein